MTTAHFVQQTIWQIRDGVNPLNRSFNYGIDSYIGYTKKNKNTKKLYKKLQRLTKKKMLLKNKSKIKNNLQKNRKKREKKRNVLYKKFLLIQTRKKFSLNKQ